MMIVTEDAQTDDNDLTLTTPDLFAPETESNPDFTIGQQLTEQQCADMKQLLSEYPEVFSDRPGRTNLIRHTIRVTDNTPSYEASYRIPEAMRDAVYDELMKMVDNNIIKYDPYTAWNSPLIVVRKSDGGDTACQQFHCTEQKNS